MSSVLDPPLTPRDGRTLQVLIVCRVSDPRHGKQDERSLDDQAAKHEEWLRQHATCPYEAKVIAGKGSGERLERREYLELIELVESRNFDLVLTEDLGRIVRRMHSHLFCELCEDMEVRLIAINDHVDTADAGWGDRSIFSAWHHERSNRDTSERIKRTHRNRFRTGGCLSLPIFGYRKPEGAKCDDNLEKIPECEPIYKEWFRRLDEGDASYAEIADWLNDKGIPPGPYSRQPDWTGPMVARVTHNWLLKGVRFRNKRKTRRNNRSGNYRSEPASAEDLLTRSVPRLAYLEPSYYDRVVAQADARNAKYRRAKSRNEDPLRGRPRKRTRFPGQSVYCGICGRLFVFGGHGQRDHLMCSGVREYKCWNTFTFSGPLACRVISDAVFDVIKSLPAFEPDFLEALREELGQQQSQQLQRLTSIDGGLREVDRQLTNIVAAIGANGSSDPLLRELRRLEDNKLRLENERNGVCNAVSAQHVEIPTLEQVQDSARAAFTRLAEDTPEFGRLLCRLLPTIYARPVRLCDGGMIGLRGSLTFTAAPLLSNQVRSLPTLRARLARKLDVNLFDAPQREAFRERVVGLRSEGETERQVAAALGITTTAAQRAAALQRQMDLLGIADPWLLLQEPPPDFGKLRVHLHPRFRFGPLEGFPLRAYPETGVF